MTIEGLLSLVSGVVFFIAVTLEAIHLLMCFFPARIHTRFLANMNHIPSHSCSRKE